LTGRRRGGRHRRRPSRSRSARVLTALALVALAAGSGLAGARLLGGVRVERSLETGDVPVATPTGSTPTTGREAATRSPSPAAAPADPRPLPGVPIQLTLPTERVSAPIVPAGSRPNGELRLPRSPHVVSWWVRSAPAGDPRDSTLIGGHVDSAKDGVGVLAALREIDIGSRVVLTDTFGVQHGYRVAARRLHPKYALPEDVFKVTGRAGLVLITCGGPFDEDAGRYRDNVVVYAVPG
jgi:hypothetical protein